LSTIRWFLGGVKHLSAESCGIKGGDTLEEIKDVTHQETRKRRELEDGKVIDLTNERREKKTAGRKKKVFRSPCVTFMKYQR